MELIGITDTDSGIPPSFIKEEWASSYWDVVAHAERYKEEYRDEESKDIPLDASDVSNFLIVFFHLMKGGARPHHSVFVKELFERVDKPGYTPIAQRILDDKKMSARVDELINDPVELWKTVSGVLDDVIVGEKFNKLTLFLLILGMEHVYVTGDSSSGKSHLIGNVLKVFPQEWLVTLGDMSEKAMQYMDWGYQGPGPQDNPTKRILYLQEFVAVSDTKDKQFRLLSGDDGGMIWTTTVRKEFKTPEGGKESKFVTQEGRTPQLSFVTSTTRADLNEENMTRAWRIIPSPSSEQTSDIVDRDNTLAMYPWRRPRTFDRLNEIRAVLKRLDPKMWRGKDNKYRVSQPFLTLCNFPVTKVRIRRDRSKVERMAAIITIINQHERPRVVVNGLEYLIGSAGDLALALYLTQQILQHTLLGIDDKGLNVWNLVDHWEKQKENLDEENVGMTITDMMETSDVAYSQRRIQETCKYLQDTGYLYSTKIVAQGSPNGYFTKLRLTNIKLDVDWNMKKEIWSMMKESIKSRDTVNLDEFDEIILNEDFPDSLRVVEESHIPDAMRRRTEYEQALKTPLESSIKASTRDDEIAAKIETMESMNDER